MEGYTNLAQICSDQCPFQIVCVEYGNNDKTAVIQIRRFEGSILRQFEQCLEFLKSILLAGMTKGAGNGLDSTISLHTETFREQLPVRFM